MESQVPYFTRRTTSNQISGKKNRKTSVIMLVAGLASAALPAFSQEETWRQEISALQRASIYPVLAGVAAFGDQRSVEPFLKPLAPRGYVMATAPDAHVSVATDRWSDACALRMRLSDCKIAGCTNPFSGKRR
jgi:hypothetical protein